ncbi:hypothetical protein FRC03_001197, partial [Tulasnella sp. 419]
SKQFWAKWIAENPNFEKPVFYDADFPICPWESDLDENRAFEAELMRYNMATIMHSFKPLLLLDGTPSDVVDRMVDSAIEELNNLKARGYVKWLYVWMNRTNAPWTERLETPEVLEPVPSVYFTEEYKREKAMYSSQRSAIVVAQSKTPGPPSTHVVQEEVQLV